MENNVIVLVIEKFGFRASIFEFTGQTDTQKDKILFGSPINRDFHFVSTGLSGLGIFCSGDG